ncbi:elongator complex protein 3 [Oceanirhabdus sp. W0125-5]|uniref:elongator complex protein 3 n=1 Tax=Oceanirhabdus sp. W0125-5 TaxID=2999116 RepID=UPI0022F33EAD|nr:radical SAM protein [Oceanirhabdus sp. W0125-5]WBW94804.1 radical SAM protein [Oceanirhabdus sp. W0125-5]
MSKSYYIIPVFVPHEGCPHDCAFCNQHSITGNREEISTSKIRMMIEEYLQSINTKKDKEAVVEISFFGGTFTGIDIKKQKMLLNIAKEYKSKGKIKYIRLSTRPDYINDEILKNLKDYDVDIIELGAQSFDDEVLKAANRGHTAEDIEKASRLIKEYGFTLGIQLMLGLPKADFHRDFYSAKKAVEVKPDFTRLYPALVIKNTEMESMYETGEYTPYTIEECIEITKKIFAFFEVNDIKVIRIGLQPTTEISSGSDLVSGPFHPAIRELIEGSLINDMISSSIIDLKEDVKLIVNQKDLSKLYCWKKKFFNKLLLNFDGNLKVETSEEIKRNEFVVQCRKKIIKLELRDYLNELVKKIMGDEFNEKKKKRENS